jgi:uncharacterized protein (DUF1684 family)
MKITIEDETEGTTWTGYLSIEVVDDEGDVVLDANIAPEAVDAIGEAYLDLAMDPDMLRLLAEQLDDEPDPEWI